MMKEMELHVRMTKDEYDKILPRARNHSEGGTFAKGDMCFYNGTPYLCMKDNNYYYPSADDSEGQSQQPQQIVIHNYIQGNNEDQGVSSSQEEKVLYDPMKNVRIDAEGVDVVFEVVDGVYSISIKAREPEQQVQQEAEEPASESFMVDWYEVIKIALLGAIVFVVKKK